MRRHARVICAAEDKHRGKSAQLKECARGLQQLAHDALWFGDEPRRHGFQGIGASTGAKGGSAGLTRRIQGMPDRHGNAPLPSQKPPAA